MKGCYTEDEVKALAEKNNIGVLEDVCLVLIKGDQNIPLYSIGCQEKPPYKNLYFKNKVNSYIKILNDLEKEGA